MQKAECRLPFGNSTAKVVLTMSHYMQHQTLSKLFQLCHQLNAKGCKWLPQLFSFSIYLLIFLMNLFIVWQEESEKKAKCSDTALVSNPARYLVCCHTTTQAGCRLAQLVKRLCLCCSGPGFKSCPRTLFCVSLALILFSCLLLSCSLSKANKSCQ